MTFEDWKQTLGTVSRDEWIARNGVDPFSYHEQEDDVWETIIPVETMGRVILMKTYIDGVPMLKTYTHFDDDIPAETKAYVAMWSYEGKDGIYPFPESVYLDRMEAERRLFELRGEWAKRKVLIDIVKIEDNGDHVSTQELPKEWYERVRPMFKVKCITINPRKDDNEKANQKD